MTGGQVEEARGDPVEDLAVVARRSGTELTAAEIAAAAAAEARVRWGMERLREHLDPSTEPAPAFRVRSQPPAK